MICASKRSELFSLMRVRSAFGEPRAQFPPGQTVDVPA